MEDTVLNRYICNKVLRPRTPINQIKVTDIPEPSKINADQLLLPFLSKNGEFQKTPAGQTEINLSSPTNPVDSNPYSLKNTKKYDLSPERDTSLDYMGNKIKTLFEYAEENKEKSDQKRKKKNYFVQKNFENRQAASTKAKDIDYLTMQINIRKNKEQYRYNKQ